MSNIIQLYLYEYKYSQVLTNFERMQDKHNHTIPKHSSVQTYAME